MKKLNTAICISGGGSTMETVLRACARNRLPRINPALIISSKADAGGIHRAKNVGFPENDITILDRKNYASREAYGLDILRECDARKIDLIFQCGFIPIMPSNVLTVYYGMVFNQHPGPIDGTRLGFGGKGMHGRAVHHAVLYFAERVGRPMRTEASVHFVTNEVDGGGIVGIHPVELNLKTDTAEILAERVLPYEHELVISTLFIISEFGFLQAISRKTPLIRKGEESLLEEAKAEARKAFPNG